MNDVLTMRTQIERQMHELATLPPKAQADVFVTDKQTQMARDGNAETWPGNTER